MKVFHIAVKDIILTLKDKRAIAIIVIMPIVLIFALGISLSSMFEGATVNLSKFQVGVVNEDNGEEAGSLIEFLESSDMKEYFTIVEGSYDEMTELIDAGKIEAFIHVPKDYTKNIQDGNSVNVTLVEKDSDSVNSTIITDAVNGYIKTQRDTYAAIDAANEALKEYNIPGEAIMTSLSDVFESEDKFVTVDSITDTGKNISAIQYYSAAMVAMYILFVGMVGTSSLIEERETNTLMRLNTTRVSKSGILLGKFLALFVLGIMDIAVIILFSKFAFGVKWGNSIPGLCILSLALSFAACGLSMMIATIFKSSKAVDVLNPLLIMGMAFIGGNMIPLYEMNENIQKVGLILLNNCGMKGYLNLMINNGIESILLPSAVLVGMGIVFLLIGRPRLKLQ